MKKLSMCRICLVENVRMYEVVNKKLHKLYEKLTDEPFLTKDRRPVIACFFCCAKLKQCYRLLRKCLEAEGLFTKMMYEGYEPGLLRNSNHLDYFNGLTHSSMEHVSIVENNQTESVAIKEKSPTGFDRLDDTDYAVEKNKSDELELENPDKSNLGVEDIPAIECTQSELDSEVDVSLMQIKTKAKEGQKASKMKRRTCVTRRAAVAKNWFLSLKRKLEEIIPAKPTMNVPSDSKITRRSRTSTSESVAKNKESVTSISQSSYNNSTNLIQHSRIHADEKSFICDICQHSFHNKNNLKKHVRKHTGESPFKCNVCQCSFKSNYNLKLHLRKHSSDSLKRHTRVHTDGKFFKCDVCQHSFSSKHSLIVHFRKHSGEKPFKWQRSFNKKGNSNQHVRIHAGEKPFKCDICQRSFTRSCHLKDHLRIHTGEKPYKCDACQRSFTQSTHLKQHLRIHTGEKPHKCDVCQRRFNQSSQLKLHLRIHTGEKPYKCNVCRRSFSLKSSLDTHSTQHTGKKPYQCDVCQRSFNRISLLKKHSSSH
ncbi:hypothetical protein PYW07_012630 [Mythimna separata]|uniref:Uncharacterized protein n=1 Tax=Mythimna separata TaxID=271217 RepID=A0AAD8DLH1_MYTSE|nr:hypothetical protein PYW07_012630 [Mythimna separata]